MNALLQHRGHVLMGAGHSIAVQNFNENIGILVMLGALRAAGALGRVDQRGHHAVRPLRRRRRWCWCMWRHRINQRHGRLAAARRRRRRTQHRRSHARHQGVGAGDVTTPQALEHHRAGRTARSPPGRRARKMRARRALIALDARDRRLLETALAEGGLHRPADRLPRRLADLRDGCRGRRRSRRPGRRAAGRPARRCSPRCPRRAAGANTSSARSRGVSRCSTAPSGNAASTTKQTWPTCVVRRRRSPRSMRSSAAGGKARRAER